MAFDRIQPPDYWESTIARLLFRLVCCWSTGSKRPQFSDFTPRRPGPPRQMTEAEVLAAFGIKPS